MNPVDLMLQVIHDYSPKSIWTGAPLEAFRRVENTNRGDIGEEFLVRYLGEQIGFSVAKSGTRGDRQDMLIEGRRFEVKTASLGANGTFQFNHVRLDRDYLYLLCLGVCPDGMVPFAFAWWLMVDSRKARTQPHLERSNGWHASGWNSE